MNRKCEYGTHKYFFRSRKERKIAYCAFWFLFISFRPHFLGAHKREMGGPFLGRSTPCGMRFTLDHRYLWTVLWSLVIRWRRGKIYPWTRGDRNSSFWEREPHRRRRFQLGCSSSRLFTKHHLLGQFKFSMSQNIVEKFLNRYFKQYLELHRTKIK